MPVSFKGKYRVRNKQLYKDTLNYLFYSPEKQLSCFFFVFGKESKHFSSNFALISSTFFQIEILKNPDNIPQTNNHSHSDRGGRGGHRGGRHGPGGGHKHDEPSYGCVKLSDPRAKN